MNAPIRAITHIRETMRDTMSSDFTGYAFNNKPVTPC
jgi:hypothetical protein